MRIPLTFSETVLAAVGTIALIALIARPDEPKTGPAMLSAIEINALPATGAGIPSGPQFSAPPAPAQVVPAPRSDAYMGGTKAKGVVSEIYLKVGQGVFLALDQAPAHLRNSAERWVEVEFPDVLANGSGTTRAMIDSNQPSIALGDVVEIRFAHKESRDSARFFPVKETTRVTELVAKHDEKLAAEFQRRVYARTGHGLAQANAPTDQPGWLRPSPNAQTGLMESLQAASRQAQ